MIAEETINDILNFVEEENNDSDSDLEDLVGEHRHMEVEFDDNIERRNNESLEKTFIRNITWTWELRKKKTSNKNVDVSKKSMWYKFIIIWR